MTIQDQQEFKKLIIETLESKEGQKALIEAMKTEKKSSHNMWKKILKMRTLEHEKRIGAIS